jgi:hypothetical protein
MHSDKASRGWARAFFGAVFDAVGRPAMNNPEEFSSPPDASAKPTPQAQAKSPATNQNQVTSPERVPWKTKVRSYYESGLRRTKEAWLRLRYHFAPSAIARTKSAMQNTTRRERITAAVVLVLLLLMVFSAFRYFGGSKDSVQQRVVARWLDAQAAGGNGFEFTEPGSEAAGMHFHSLKSWKIVSKPRPGLFRVELTSDVRGSTSVGYCDVTVAESTRESGKSQFKVIQVVLNPQNSH